MRVIRINSDNPMASVATNTIIKINMKVKNLTKNIIGNFLNGMQHGEGKMAYENGRVYNGNWEDGVIEGQGEFTIPNGITYKGNHNNGKRNGIIFLLNIRKG